MMTAHAAAYRATCATTSLSMLREKVSKSFYSGANIIITVYGIYAQRLQVTYLTDAYCACQLFSCNIRFAGECPTYSFNEIK